MSGPVSRIGAAPRGFKSGKGITERKTAKGFVADKIGECPVCFTWHKLYGGSIPSHTRGHATYDPFPSQTT